MGDKGASSGKGSGSGGARAFSGDEDILEYEINEFSDWKANLTDEQLKAAQEYALDSTRLNGYLRGDNEAPRNMDVDAVTEALDGAISHPLSTPMTLYRGVGTDYLGLDLSNEDAVKGLVGKTIRDPAYMSTAISRDVGETYSRGAMFKVSVPKGKKVMSPDIAESTTKQLRSYLADGDIGNTELVFKRNSGLKITGYKKRTTSSGRTMFEIEAKMV